MYAQFENEIYEIVKEVEERWTTPDGMVSLKPHKGHITENDILWTAHFWCLLQEIGILSSELRPIVSMILTKNRQKLKAVLDSLETSPGIHNERPYFTGEPLSWDNHNGITVLDIVAGSSHSERICEYGSRNGWIFNNHPQKIPFVTEGNRVRNFSQPRQLKEVAWYKIAAGWKPSIWEYVWMVLGMFVSVGKDSLDHNGNVESSGKMMIYLKLLHLKRRGSFWKAYFLYFIERMQDHYGKEDPIANLYKVYFNLGATQEVHPIVKLVEIVETIRHQGE